MSKKTSPKDSEMPSAIAVAPDPLKQRTLLVRNLRTGLVYRDVLSGFLVLVQERSSEGPDPADIRRKLKEKHRVGYYYNPLYGTHQTMPLYDHQFINANTPFGFGVPL